MSKTVSAVAAKFGGVRQLARKLKIDHASVIRWKHGIPAKHQSRVLRIAKRDGIAVTAADLVAP